MAALVFLIWEILIGTISAFVCFTWFMDWFVPRNEQKILGFRSFLIVVAYVTLLSVNLFWIWKVSWFPLGFSVVWWHYVFVFFAFFMGFFLNLMFAPYLK